MATLKESAMMSKILDWLGKPFKPPFTGLALLIWVYFIFCYLCFPNSYIWRGALVESDNYAYLVQTLDWLQGQNWFDNVQHRLAPPEGVLMHFSRLTELPIAALIVLFHLAAMGWTAAAAGAAMVLPPLLLVCLFMALRWVAETLMPREWIPITAFVALFSQALLFQFSLGHIGHRAPAAILILLAVGCVFRFLLDARRLKYAALAGFLLALSLTLALETLPWLLLLSLGIGLWLLAKRREAARPAMLYGAALLASSFVLLVISKAPEAWFSTEITSFSITYVILCGLITLCMIAVAVAGYSRHKNLPLIVGGLLAFYLGAFFIHAFPALSGGPYGAMNPELAKIFFGFIHESRPFTALAPLWVIAVSLSPSLLALGVSVFFWLRSEDKLIWLWAFSSLLLLAALMLTVNYQYRFLRYVNLFSLVPLSVFLQQGCSYVAARWGGRRRWAAVTAVIMLAGPLLTVLVPAAIDGRPLVTGILLFPMRDVKQACDLQAIEPILQSADLTGKSPQRIVNMLDTGAELLFRTKHQVMSAPYHNNARGNLDAVSFFRAQNPAEAERLAQADRFDLVLLCRVMSPIYAQRENPDQPTFAEQLLQQQIPAWLQPVAVPESSGFLLFKVNR